MNPIERLRAMTDAEKLDLLERFDRYYEGERGGITFGDAEILIAIADEVVEP